MQCIPEVSFLCERFPSACWVSVGGEGKFQVYKSSPCFEREELCSCDSVPKSPAELIMKLILANAEAILILIGLHHETSLIQIPKLQVNWHGLP